MRPACWFRRLAETIFSIFLSTLPFRHHARRTQHKKTAAALFGERRLPACRGRHLAERICTYLPCSRESRLAAGGRQLQAGSLCFPKSAMITRWNRKDLLGLRELSVDEINLVLETADAFKQVGTREIKKVPALRGKTLVNFFVEPSTRTRTSFELAAVRLSADVINISAATSSLSKGESLKDTAKVLEANHVDIIVLRHSSAGAPQFLAERLRSSVINAGDGAHEHPTQGLLDTYTIREKKKRIEGLNVAIIGDILFSRVARSNIFALTKLGARVTLVGPSTLLPLDFEKLGVTISYDIDEVLPTADVVNLLRIQHERQRKEYFPGIGEYIKLFGLTKERAKLLKPDCLIMHPGPINRGVEIDSELADGNQSVILDQVTNGLAVRMAVLYLCGGIAA